MLCYKDMVFCTAKDCANMECIRNTRGPHFTPDEWWANKVAYADIKDGCHEYRKEDRTNT